MMYSKMKELEAAGFSQRNIAKQLNVSRNTVKKYLEKDVEDFTTWLSSTKDRKQKLDPHKDRILKWLRSHPDLSAAQIHDWLEERGFTDIAESTLRRYVKGLREEYHIPKTVIQRQYEAIPDPPMGEQAQVDFGQIWVENRSGQRVKLYVIAFVLSHSRYKYMEWWDRPYTAKDVIQAHEHAFQFFGGKPKTIVYDQDRAVFVSENYGELIFTAEFEAYRQSQHFKIHACRPYDPESKGRIENVIGFIKNNFAKNRLYTNLDSWNEQALSWLRRKGNGKRHNTTKKVPLKVFQEEQCHLLPFHSFTKQQSILSEAHEIRRVHKDNTIKYKTNRYSLPRQTYSRLKEVAVVVSENQSIRLLDPETGEILATHELCLGHGKLIKNRSHSRDTRQSVEQLINQTAAQFQNKEQATTYLTKLHKTYPRYTRDQISLIASLFKDYPKEILTQSLTHCERLRILSATGFRDVVKQMDQERRAKAAVKQLENLPAYPPLSDETKQKLDGVEPEVRQLDTYTNLLGGVKK